MATSLPAIETPVAVDEEPSRKRRRIDGPSDNGLSHSKGAEIRTEAKSKSDNNAKTTDSDPIRDTPRKSAQNLTSTANRISPPPTKSRAVTEKDKGNIAMVQKVEKAEKKQVQSGQPVPRKQVKKESLNPRHLSKPPASHPIRMSILVKLHEAMVNLNKQIAQSKDQSKNPLVLAQDELIAMALDEEEKAAKDNPLIYSNVVKLRITKLRKIPLADWEKDVLAFLKLTPSASDPSKIVKQEITTGLKPKEEIIVLSKLVARPDKLQQAGYVTTAPTEEDIKAAKAGADASQGWEKCDRCSGRFQVFPGRRGDGLLASGGECTYHYARPIYPQRQKTDHITGHKEAYYPCCNETMGTSSGCTKSQWHVFKVSETKRLASIMQFEKTPSQPDKGPLPPVCFDCEMGYTTLGLELIRLTAITWPQGKELIDVLVRPKGEILDFNTRYSGVKPEQFANAIPYSASGKAPADDKSQAPQSQSSLRIVNSPSEARDLLFRHIQPETPLIGHALDNDLNACRIIHPTIVDTVLLYPHPRGLPMRFSLRTLTRKFLDRYIQTGGGDQGHDSLEDSRATGDLVRVKVKEIWKGLKGAGWKIEGDRLVDPRTKQGTITVEDRQTPKLGGVGPGVLGQGAGTKRKEH